MSNKELLKKYLIDGESPFLLNDINNGKTIMISGSWGSGKTHFWKYDIEPNLTKALKEKSKTCVYVSLYGKDSLDSLKKEVYINAFSEKDIISKEISAFGFDAISSIKNSDLSIGKALSAFNHIRDYIKENKGANKLKDGGVVCFDDFERKSSKIDLNDLFGFISQLAIDMNCKIIIILNSYVFKGKEAEIFKTVKEKTINKFFYYEPTIEELFKSIASDEKYNTLNKYKEDILKSIQETEELNARIYMQVLDNCLEWLNLKKNLEKATIRVLVLSTFNFILNHIIFDYIVPQQLSVNSDTYFYDYKEVDFSVPKINEAFNNVDRRDNRRFKVKDLSYAYYNMSENDFFKFLAYKSNDRNYLENNEKQIKAIWKYGYRLFYVNDVNKKLYGEIMQFIKTGILI